MDKIKLIDVDVEIKDLITLVERLMKMTGINDSKEVVDYFNSGNWVLNRVNRINDGFLDVASRVDIKISDVSSDIEVFLFGTKGIDVGNAFRDYFINQSKILLSSENISLLRCNAGNNRSDEDIRARLPSGYVFTAEEFCPTLVVLLRNQMGKVDHNKHLLKSGQANVFFVLNKEKSKICVVHVRFANLFKEWRIRMFELGEYRWRDNDQVLFPDRKRNQ